MCRDTFYVKYVKGMMDCILEDRGIIGTTEKNIDFSSVVTA